MIIFDTKNNYDNRIKGMLYLSLMDIDYLISTYGVDNLRKMIPEDYVNHFICELNRHSAKNPLSSQYYAVVSLGIETENDESLLTLLKGEIEIGNLFTKSQLEAIKEDEIDILLAEARKNYIKGNPESLYKLRSYMMLEYIFFSIEEYNKSVEESYARINLPNNQRNILTSNNNWQAMGISKSVEESAYFKDAIELAKRLKG